MTSWTNAPSMMCYGNAFLGWMGLLLSGRSEILLRGVPKKPGKALLRPGLPCSSPSPLDFAGWSDRYACLRRRVNWT